MNEQPKKKVHLGRVNARRVEDWLIANRKDIEGKLDLDQITELAAKRLGIERITANNVEACCKIMGVKPKARNVTRGTGREAILKELCRVTAQIADQLEIPYSGLKEFAARAENGDAQK